MTLGCTGPLMRNKQTWALMLLIGLLIQQIPVGDSASYGISDVEGGCTCHNAVPSDSVQIHLEGIPERYQANQTYTLNISATGGATSIENFTNRGGFNLWMSRGVLSNISDDVQVFSNNEVGHTESGNNQRAWVVNWTAPDDDTLSVQYRLHINTVNGDGVPSDLDQWNREVGEFPGVNGVVSEPVSNLFLFGVPIVMISLMAWVYIREMRKLDRPMEEE